MKTSILVINYYWPPSGGSAVQRWVDIVSFLCKKDVECYVLTVDEKFATYPSIDDSLVFHHPNLQVYKTKTGDILQSYKRITNSKKNITQTSLKKDTFFDKFSKFIRGNFFIPDARKGWNKIAEKKAIEIVRKHKIQTIITAGPPHSTHLVGKKVQQQTNVKWIADFHDYWSSHYNLPMFYRTYLAQKWDEHLEKSVLSNADLVLTHCQESRQVLLKKNYLKKSQIMVHTMGYNEQLFSKVNEQNEQSHFTITYTGKLGRNYESDVFFHALKEVVTQFENVPFKFVFAGLINEKILSLIKKLGIEYLLDYKGYVSHEESISLLEKSTLLLLANPKDINEKMIVPGKIYEYIAARKPIISISVNGCENEQLIRDFSKGANFDRTEKKQLVSYLTSLVEDWKLTKNLDIPYNQNIQKFSRDTESSLLLAKIIELSNQ